jgi:hypothetical protein
MDDVRLGRDQDSLTRAVNGEIEIDLVEPTWSAWSMMCGGHSGCAATGAPGCSALSFSSSVSLKAWWTMQMPGHSSISRPSLRATDSRQGAVGPKMIFWSFGNLVEDDLRARRGDDDVAERLSPPPSSYVGQRDMVRMGLAKALNCSGGQLSSSEQPASMSGRITVFSARDLRRLSHEANAAKGDDIGIGRRRLARQIKAVADEIGEVLDFRLLVIMGKDDALRSFFRRAISESRSMPFRLCGCAVTASSLRRGASAPLRLLHYMWWSGRDS